MPGRDIMFDPGGDDVVGALHGGLAMELALSGGMTLYAAGSGRIETDGSHGAAGNIGARISF